MSSNKIHVGQDYLTLLPRDEPMSCEEFSRLFRLIHAYNTPLLLSAPIVVDLEARSHFSDGECLTVSVSPLPVIDSMDMGKWLSPKRDTFDAYVPAPVGKHYFAQIRCEEKATDDVNQHANHLKQVLEQELPAHDPASIEKLATMFARAWDDGQVAGRAQRASPVLANVLSCESAHDARGIIAPAQQMEQRVMSLPSLPVVATIDNPRPPSDTHSGLLDTVAKGSFSRGAATSLGGYCSPYLLRKYRNLGPNGRVFGQSGLQENDPDTAPKEIAKFLNCELESAVREGFIASPVFWETPPQLTTSSSDRLKVTPVDSLGMIVDSRTPQTGPSNPRFLTRLADLSSFCDSVYWSRIATTTETPKSSIVDWHRTKVRQREEKIPIDKVWDKQFIYWDYIFEPGITPANQPSPPPQENKETKTMLTPQQLQAIQDMSVKHDDEFSNLDATPTKFKDVLKRRQEEEQAAKAEAQADAVLALYAHATKAKQGFVSDIRNMRQEITARIGMLRRIEAAERASEKAENYLILAYVFGNFHPTSVAQKQEFEKLIEQAKATLPKQVAAKKAPAKTA